MLDARLAGLARAFVALLLRAPFIVVVFVARTDRRAASAVRARPGRPRWAPDEASRVRQPVPAGPSPGDPDLRGGRGQATLTALQAAATALYCVLPAPYRSRAAFSVAVRAPG